MKQNSLIRLVSLLCLLAIVFSGCGKKTEDTVPDAIVPTVTEPPADATPANLLAYSFKTYMAENPSAMPIDIAQALLESGAVPFDGVAEEVEPGYLNGFTAEIEDFSDGAFFGPMIGAIPFVAYVFHIEGDSDAFATKLQENADLRWNICTEADEMVCETVGDTVFFVMAPVSFEN